MKTHIKILGGLVILQLLLVSIIFFTGNDNSKFEPKTLIDIDFDSIDEIKINDQQAELTLIKKNETWMIDGEGELPIKDAPVSELFEQLSTLKVNWPVAKTSAAAERFEVSEENFQKSIILLSEDKPKTKLFIGTSPGLRKHHLRLNNEGEIYSAEIAQHRISAMRKDWFDRTLLSVKGDISAVKTNRFHLLHNNETWQNADDSEMELDSTKVDAWTQRFQRLEVSDLVDKTHVEAIIITNPLLTVEIASENGIINFAIYSKDKRYFIKRYDDDRLFELEGYIAEPIEQVDIDSFFPETAEDDESLTKEAESNK